MTIQEKLKRNGFHFTKKVEDKEYYTNLSKNYNSYLVILDTTKNRIINYLVKNTEIRSELDIEKLSDDFTTLKDFVRETNETEQNNEIEELSRNRE